LIPVYPPCDCSRIAVFLLSCNLRKQQQIVSRVLSVVVCATVEYKSPLCILAVIYLQCMKLCLAKGIIIPFAYNSSESGSGHISHRNLIWLIIVFVVCVNIYSHLHCFSLVRSTVIGGELSGDISPKYVSFINICFGMAFTNVILYIKYIILLETNLHHQLLFYTHKNQNLILINLLQTYLFHTNNYNTS